MDTDCGENFLVSISEIKNLFAGMEIYAGYEYAMDIHPARPGYYLVPVVVKGIEI